MSLNFWVWLAVCTFLLACVIAKQNISFKRSPCIIRHTEMLQCLNALSYNWWISNWWSEHLSILGLNVLISKCLIYLNCIYQNVINKVNSLKDFVFKMLPIKLGFEIFDYQGRKSPPASNANFCWTWPHDFLLGKASKTKQKI